MATCIYMWCKKIGEGADAHFEFLTPEEEAIKRSIISKYYGDTTEQKGMVGLRSFREINWTWQWGFFQELEDELLSLTNLLYWFIYILYYIYYISAIERPNI